MKPFLQSIGFSRCEIEEMYEINYNPRQNSLAQLTKKKHYDFYMDYLCLSLMGYTAGFLTPKARYFNCRHGSSIVEFSPMKRLSVFGFIECKRMKRTCDFWAEILWTKFKRSQQ